MGKQEAMTADRRAALVERISRAIVSQDSKDKGHEDLVWKVYIQDAETALDLALEEAARVAEQHPDAGLATRRDWTVCIGPDIAAAIRALKEKPSQVP